jgi:hypothetical protein
MKTSMAGALVEDLWKDSHSYFNSYLEEDLPSKEELRWPLFKLASGEAETCKAQEEAGAKGKED